MKNSASAFPYIGASLRQNACLPPRFRKDVSSVVQRRLCFPVYRSLAPSKRRPSGRRFDLRVIKERPQRDRSRFLWGCFFYPCSIRERQTVFRSLVLFRWGKPERAGKPRRRRKSLIKLFKVCGVRGRAPRGRNSVAKPRKAVMPFRAEPRKEGPGAKPRKEGGAKRC